MNKGKRSFSIFLVVCIFLLFLSLVSCNSESGNKSTSSSDTTQNSENNSESSNKVQEYTITYKNGDKVLKTTKAKEGEKITAWDASTTITDEFFGWFAEPTLKHAFDFTQPITEDKTIFGSFVGYQKDERKWCIAGSGSSSVLSSSNWGKVFNKNHEMTNASTSSKNIFKLTVNLFANDQFQFTDPQTKDGKVSWGHQRGAGYLKDAKKDNVEYFSIGGGLGGDNSTANITCLKDGKYEFVLTTYPKGDFQKDNTQNLYDNRSYFDTITYTYLGECEEERPEVETIYYIKGKLITSWGDYLNDYTKMVASADKKTVELKNVYLITDDEFMFATKNKNVATGVVTDGNEYIRATNLTDEAKRLVSGTANMKVNENGYYNFVYTIESKTLNITKTTFTPKTGNYYIDGSFISWKGAGDDNYQLVQDETNQYIYKLAKNITLAKDDQIGLQYYDKTNKEYNGFFSSNNMVKCDEFDLTANNAKALVAGEYKVEFNAYSHLLTISKVTE